MTPLIAALVSATLLQPAAQPPAAKGEPPAAVPSPDPSKTITVEAAIQPAPPPPKVMPGAGDANIADSDALLSALETAGDKIRTLSADLTHINKKSELEAGQEILKRGRLLFKNEPAPPPAAGAGPDKPVAPDKPAAPDKPGALVPPAPAPPAGQPRKVFQIDFTQVEFNDKQLDEDTSFIFDGHWLVEKQNKNRQMFKYEVVPPGQVADPLAVGEGPFPMPIGQKRERILARFHVTLMRPEDGFPTPLTDSAGKPLPGMDWVAGTYQLRLIPKPGVREARDFQEVRLWYNKADLLPRMAKTIKRDDSSDEVMLRNVVINQPLPEGAFDITKPEGWNLQVDNFHARNADQ